MNTGIIRAPQILSRSFEYPTSTEAVAQLKVRDVTGVKVSVKVGAGQPPSDIAGWTSRLCGDTALVRVIRHGYAEYANPLLITVVLTNTDESGAGFSFESQLGFVWPQPRAVDHIDALQAMGAIPADERLAVMANFCRGCGRRDPKCRCWDDA
jgi:hypothetical protein